MIYATTTCKILAAILAPVAFFLSVTAPDMPGMQGGHKEFLAILMILSLAGIIASEDRLAFLCSGIIVGIMVCQISPYQPWQGGFATAAAAFCLLVLGASRADAAEKKRHS